MTQPNQTEARAAFYEWWNSDDVPAEKSKQAVALATWEVCERRCRPEPINAKLREAVRRAHHYDLRFDPELITLFREALASADASDVSESRPRPLRSSLLVAKLAEALDDITSAADYLQCGIVEAEPSVTKLRESLDRVLPVLCLVCSHCHGKGVEPESMSHLLTCRTCGGSGEAPHPQEVRMGEVVTCDENRTDSTQ
jgi:hypothetical protein